MPAGIVLAGGRSSRDRIARDPTEPPAEGDDVAFIAA
jgi:hypothetical protein